MKRHARSLVVGVAVFAGALPAPPEITILNASEGCGEVTLHALPGEGFSLHLSSFKAQTSPIAPRVRRVCVVQLAITTPENVTVQRGTFEVAGTAIVAPGTTGSNLSVRYFAPGEAGADYHRELTPSLPTSLRHRPHRSLLSRATGP
jgi:hypothetical protein